MTNDPLQTYISGREALLEAMGKTLSADERFVAAWLTGSFGRNDADAVSDLDLTAVVSDAYCETLCARPRQISSQTTKERLDLISQFGQPAIIHENHYNAPEGGTFTFVLYARSAVMIDWVLRPQAKAERPSQSRLLFDKVGIPLSPCPEPQSLEQRMETASHTIAFFWMMTAVTAKNVFRHDGGFVTCWLEELHKLVREVEYLVEGTTPPYHRGSISVLEATGEGQVKAIYRLSDRMLKLMPAVAKLGGYVSTSPMPAIELLLNLADDK